MSFEEVFHVEHSVSNSLSPIDRREPGGSSIHLVASKLLRGEHPAATSAKGGGQQQAPGDSRSLRGATWPGRLPTKVFHVEHSHENSLMQSGRAGLRLLAGPEFQRPD